MWKTPVEMTFTGKTHQFCAVHGLIQDLGYATKAISRTSDPRVIDEMNYDAENIYLKALIGIIVKLIYKEIYVEGHERCGGCANEEPG